MLHRGRSTQADFCARYPQRTQSVIIFHVQRSFAYNYGTNAAPERAQPRSKQTKAGLMRVANVVGGHRLRPSGPETASSAQRRLSWQVRWRCYNKK
jgi:hypothetical protein